MRASHHDWLASPAERAAADCFRGRLVQSPARLIRALRWRRFRAAPWACVQRRLGVRVPPADWLRQLYRAPGWPAPVQTALRQLQPGFVTGWSLAADSALWLYHHLRSSGCRTMLECGCGLTSVVIGLALRDRSHSPGPWCCYCLEHDEDWLEKTRFELGRLNLGALVRLVHAPLVRVSAGGGELFTYDVTTIPQCNLDFVLVDGPPRGTSRADIVPRIRDRLSPGALVVLDDAGRTPEQQCCETWVRECGLQLHGFLTLGHGLALLSAPPLAGVGPEKAGPLPSFGSR